MSRLELKGCGTALITPFRGGEVDYDAYRKLIAGQIEAGIDFLLALGTTAETPCLTDEEKCRLLEITREMWAGKPLVAGAGTNSLDSTVRNIRMLEPYGPDAFLIVVPYYNKPSRKGMLEYFKAVAASTSKEIIIYNVPGRTGSNMTPDVAMELAQIPNITAIKEASGNLDQIVEMIRLAPEGFKVFSGNDDQTWPLMACGAAGVISVASNIAPKLMEELTSAALDGDMAKAKELNLKLVPLYRDCFIESNPIPVKAALSLMGVCTPEVRLPLSEAEPSTFETMSRLLKDLGIC